MLSPRCVFQRADHRRCRRCLVQCVTFGSASVAAKSTSIHTIENEHTLGTSRAVIAHKRYVLYGLPRQEKIYFLVTYQVSREPPPTWRDVTSSSDTARTGLETNGSVAVLLEAPRGHLPPIAGTVILFRSLGDFFSYSGLRKFLGPRPGTARANKQCCAVCAHERARKRKT